MNGAVGMFLFLRPESSLGFAWLGSKLLSGASLGAGVQLWSTTFQEEQLLELSGVSGLVIGNDKLLCSVDGNITSLIQVFMLLEWGMRMPTKDAQDQECVQNLGLGELEPDVAD